MRISHPTRRIEVLAIAMIAATTLLAMGMPARGEINPEHLTMIGSSTYRIYCANCHGKDADGDGQVAPFLRHEPTNLTLLSKSHDGTYPADRVYRTIDGRDEVKLHGSREMPIWGDALSRPGPDPEVAVKQRIDGLVEFIRSIQKP